MTTMEKLFVQIFEKKARILEQVKLQSDNFDQHLVTKCIIDGIPPPPWLFPAAAHEDLNKEDLISGFLLPKLQHAFPFSSTGCSYQNPVATWVDTKLQDDLYTGIPTPHNAFDAGNVSSVKPPFESCDAGDVDNTKLQDDLYTGVPTPHNDFDAGNASSVLPPCESCDAGDVFDGISKPNLSVTSPLESRTPRSSDYQRLARLQRSKSRQKALELRSSAKAAKCCSSDKDDLDASASRFATFSINFQQPDQVYRSESVNPANVGNDTCAVSDKKVSDSQSWGKGGSSYAGRITISEEKESDCQKGGSNYSGSSKKSKNPDQPPSFLIVPSEAGKSFCNTEDGGTLTSYISKIAQLPNDVNEFEFNISVDQDGSGEVRKVKTGTNLSKEKENSICSGRITRSSSSTQPLDIVNVFPKLESASGIGRSYSGRTTRSRSSSQHPSSLIGSSKPGNFSFVTKEDCMQTESITKTTKEANNVNELELICSAENNGGVRNVKTGPIQSKEKESTTYSGRITRSRSFTPTLHSVNVFPKLESASLILKNDVTTTPKSLEKSVQAAQHLSYTRDEEMDLQSAQGHQLSAALLMSSKMASEVAANSAEELESFNSVEREAEHKAVSQAACIMQKVSDVTNSGNSDHMAVQSRYSSFKNEHASHMPGEWSLQNENNLEIKIDEHLDKEKQLDHHEAEGKPTNSLKSSSGVKRSQCSASVKSPLASLGNKFIGVDTREVLGVQVNVLSGTKSIGNIDFEGYDGVVADTDAETDGSDKASSLWSELKMQSASDRAGLENLVSRELDVCTMPARPKQLDFDDVNIQEPSSSNANGKEGTPTPVTLPLSACISDQFVSVRYEEERNSSLENILPEEDVLSKVDKPGRGSPEAHAVEKDGVNRTENLNPGSSVKEMSVFCTDSVACTFDQQILEVDFPTHGLIAQVNSFEIPLEDAMESNLSSVFADTSTDFSFAKGNGEFDVFKLTESVSEDNNPGNDICGGIKISEEAASVSFRNPDVTARDDSMEYPSAVSIGGIHCITDVQKRHSGINSNEKNVVSSRSSESLIGKKSILLDPSLSFDMDGLHSRHKRRKVEGPCSDVLSVAASLLEDVMQQSVYESPVILVDRNTGCHTAGQPDLSAVSLNVIKGQSEKQKLYSVLTSDVNGLSFSKSSESLKKSLLPDVTLSIDMKGSHSQHKHRTGLLSTGVLSVSAGLQEEGVNKSLVSAIDQNMEHQTAGQTESSSKLPVLEEELSITPFTYMHEDVRAPFVFSLANEDSSGCLIEEEEMAKLSRTICHLQGLHATLPGTIIELGNVGSSISGGRGIVEDKSNQGKNDRDSYDSTSGDRFMPEFERFTMPDNENLLIAGDEINFENLELQECAIERATAVEHLCKSAYTHTPLPHFSTPYKFHKTGLYQSVPNGLLECMDPRSSLSIDDASHGRSHSDCLPFGIGKPYTSPITKLWDRIASSSGSSLRASLNPELPSIIEENENLDDVADGFQQVSGKELMTDPEERVPLDQITDDSKLAPPVSEIEICARRSSLASVNTEFSVDSSHKVHEKLRSYKSSNRKDAVKGKENQHVLRKQKGITRASESVRNRFSKPKLSGKSSLRQEGSSISQHEPRRNNIVSNIKSFIPLVQQKQAPSIMTGKRDVKVKALEAAEAAKRLQEQKENERKKKKESKIEREKVVQENRRLLEQQKKKKEEEQKKKEDEMAARKRQREEEDKKERERKRKRVEESRRQQPDHQEKSRAQKNEKDTKCQKTDEVEHWQRESKDESGNEKKIGNETGEEDIEEVSEIEPRTSTSNYGLKAINNVNQANQNEHLFMNTSQEQSYDISPYKSSDDEDDDDGDIPNTKFIPSWASKSYLAAVVSSQSRLDPEVVFPLKSFCAISEVLLPRRLQLR